MPAKAVPDVADRGQRRASFQRARSHQTNRMPVQAATALFEVGVMSTQAAQRTLGELIAQPYEIGDVVLAPR